MVHGPLAGLAVLGTLAADERLTHSHRLVAVRAYLQELAGRRDEARQDYLAASRGTLNTAERRYLRIKAAELSA
jgi:predicted RNA polymerase sigma factor